MDLTGFNRLGSIFSSGVYALVYRGTVVYVGKSKEPLSRIYSHKNAWKRYRKGLRPSLNSNAKAIHFDDVWLLNCAVDDMDRIEKELIGTYAPKYNVHHNRGKETFDIKALVATLVPTKTGAHPTIGLIKRRI